MILVYNNGIQTKGEKMKGYAKGGCAVVVGDNGKILKAEYVGETSKRKELLLKLFIEDIKNGVDVSEYELKR